VLLSSAIRFAVLAALVCVMAIFFCPAAAGPYACTHGPVTAFRARRLALVVFTLLVVCATALAQAISAAINLFRIRNRRAARDVAPSCTQRLSLCCSLLC